MGLSPKTTRKLILSIIWRRKKWILISTLPTKFLWEVCWISDRIVKFYLLMPLNLWFGRPATINKCMKFRCVWTFVVYAIPKTVPVYIKMLNEYLANSWIDLLINFKKPLFMITQSIWKSIIINNTDIPRRYCRFGSRPP